MIDTIEDILKKKIEELQEEIYCNTNLMQRLHEDISDIEINIKEDQWSIEEITKG